MTSTDLAIRGSHAVATLPEKIEYARFLAKSGLLPTSFREHPENVLYAYEYGEMLGLPPIAAISGIHVIEGKPSISAGLISALVRRAGHRIRVQSTGTGGDAKARCQITRADDPGFTYSAVWDMERAKRAGLLGKTNWIRYPEAMLKARAVSECARDACQEVLLGIKYTPDELGAEDDGGELVDDGYATLPSGQVDQTRLSEETKEAAGFMPRGQRVEHDALRRMGEPPAGAVEKLTGPDPDDPWLLPPPDPATQAPATPPAETQPASPDSTPAPKNATPAALRKMEDLERQVLAGWTDPEVSGAYERITGGEWTATALQVKRVTQLLEDALASNGADKNAANTALREQFGLHPLDGTDG